MKVKKILIIVIVILLCVCVLAVAFHKRADNNGKDGQNSVITAPELIPDTQELIMEATESLSIPAEGESVAPLDDPEEIADAQSAYENRFLLVINSGHRLPDSYVPHLEEVLEQSGIYMEKEAAEAFSRMYADALKEDIVLTPRIGYTSLSRQRILFEDRTALFAEQGFSEEEAMALAARTVLPPGCSEHNAGLAIDIGEENESFSSDPAYSWLCENAYKYGFIERYQESFLETTGMDAQPWHWRYVGSDINARNIKESGLSLEDWIALVDKPIEEVMQ